MPYICIYSLSHTYGKPRGNLGNESNTPNFEQRMTLSYGPRKRFLFYSKTFVSLPD